MNLRSSPFARILAAVCLVCFAQGALANATFVLYLSGDGYVFPAPIECATCPPPIKLLWTGTATIVTNSGADGLYTGEEVSSVSFVSNIFSGAVTGPWYLSSHPHSSEPSVQVTDGAVSSLDVNWNWDLEAAFLSFDRLDASFTIVALGHGGDLHVDGSLSPIPEPGTYALMLAGIGIVGFAARGRRA